MDRDVFEVRRADAAGRLGRLEVPRSEATVETPAMLPVVNPHLQAIEPDRLAAEFGAQMLITNAYILHTSEDLRDEALESGVQELLGFPGAIMTDSGSFQLAEYGEIDVDTAQILGFQDAIGSDIATPVDVPTPPDADRERAIAELAKTEEAIATARAYDAGNMLLTAPVQGGSYPELRERAAREAYATDLDIYPIGAVVPLLRSYRFADVVELVGAVKRGLGADAPVHLFGAGHPMMFALGVALGCDLFDSAAYALYAREGRYLSVGGTVRLEELTEFPCQCPVCNANTPRSLAETDQQTTERLLAEHNLHVTFGEMRRVREAIRRGELLELVEARARSHPAMLGGYRAALALTDLLEGTDPATSPRPFFYLSSESADRPEVWRHRRRLERLDVPESIVLVDPVIAEGLPMPTPWDHADVPLPRSVDGVDSGGPRWYVLPPFGPVPPPLLETYPVTAEVPDRRDKVALERAAEGVAALVRAHQPDLTLIHAQWPRHALERLPDGVTVLEHPPAGEEDSSATAPDPDQ